MKIERLPSDASEETIQKFRSQHDCLMFDLKKLKTNDSFIVDSESFDFKLQPLRIAVISFEDINYDWKILNDRFRRNTMIIAPDDEVRNNPDVMRFLESQGVSVLMAKRDSNGLLNFESLRRSLTSLMFKTLLVEDKIDMIAELN